MILVTGATGHLGRAAVEFLLKKVPAAQLAVLVRDAAKAADLKEKGVDVRVGNYHDYSSLVKAFTGVDKLLLVSSNDFDDRLGQQKNAVNAAKEAGVKHIVYTGASLKNPEASAIGPLMDAHFGTEKHIQASGLDYTIMRNNLYADVLPMFVGAQVLETGIYLPAGTGRIAFASRVDMAEAAANILTGEGHVNKTYNIAAGETYSFADVAALLTELSGKAIAYTDADPAEFVKVLEGAGVPQQFIDMTAGFAAAMKLNEFNLPDATLERLIGRKPESLKAYVKGAFFTNN